MQNNYINLSVLEQDAPEMPKYKVLCALAIDNGKSGIIYDVGNWIPETQSFNVRVGLYGAIELLPRWVKHNSTKVSVYAYKEIGMI